jgi:group I intron endonuclease
MYFVYSLIDPRDFAIRYVGITKNLGKRLKNHLNNAAIRKEITRGNRHKGAWLHQLRSVGLKPVQSVTEVCASLEEAKEAEKFWIKLFRTTSCPLVNKTDGGEGVTGFRFTEEQKRKISEKTKEAMANPEVLAKLSQASKGRPSPRKGTKHTDETRAKMSKAAKERPSNFTGKTHNEATKQKLQHSMLEQYASGARKSRKGTHHTQEAKNKLRAAHGTRISDHLGNIYLSINQAFQTTGISRQYIRQVLEGEKEHHKGYRFFYVARD